MHQSDACNINPEEITLNLTLSSISANDHESNGIQMAFLQ